MTRAKSTCPDLPRDATTLLAVQRNHLANERTFLAWCRTAVAFFVFSFVALRFDFVLREAMNLLGNATISHKILAESRILGVSSFITGSVVLVLAAWRFFTIRRQISTLDLTYTSLPDTLLIGLLVSMVTAMAILLSLILLF
ncbi:DUF202 domain-containing protein [Fundidesulfovibrio butyratiphilus]